jgi:DNA-binding transcriptional ArsR family regulator
MEIYEAQAKLFKALMHPGRLAILEMLRGGEECVCHMEVQLGYRQAYISQQLAVLRDAGLVRDRRDGWNIYYRVIQPEIYDLIDTASRLTGAQSAVDSGALGTRRPVDDCPCPKCTVVAEKTG